MAKQERGGLDLGRVLGVLVDLEERHALGRPMC